MSNDFWGWAGKTLGQAQQTFEEARAEAERLARTASAAARTVAADATQGVAETVADLAGAESPAAQAAANLHAAVAGPPVEPIEWAAQPEQLRIAYAGALLGMAAADGAIDKDELRLLVDLTDPEGLSDGGRQMLLEFLIEPPPLRDALEPFVFADPTLRYALLLNLHETAWINDLLSEAQGQLLELARISLAVTEAQSAALANFAAQLRSVRLRGLDDRKAAEITSHAAAGLAAVGVPLTAVYVSGSVIGLKAAGITSGLAALGLGLGMATGLGVVALLGAGVYFGVRALLSGSARTNERLRAEAAHKAAVILAFLHEAIAAVETHLARRPAAAQRTADEWAQIAQLQERLRALQQLAARREMLV
jgi:hypothetical protein